MKLGEAIRVCREMKGINRSQLAEKAELSVSFLSLLENNKRDPSLSKLEKLASALEIPLSVLLFLANDKSEMESLSPELAEKLSLLALKLIQGPSDATNPLPT